MQVPLGVQQQLRTLAKVVAEQYARQKEALSLHQVHGLELGRRVWETSQNPEIVNYVAGLSKKNNAKGGRPREPFCWVAEQIEGMHAACTKNHIGRCVRAYLKAVKKSLPLNSSLRIVEGSEYERPGPRKVELSVRAKREIVRVNDRESCVYIPLTEEERAEFGIQLKEPAWRVVFVKIRPLQSKELE